MSNSTRKSVHSTWTPLGNPEFNQKLFEERKRLVGKWFDKWGDTQRKAVIKDLVEKCKLKQIEFAGDMVNLKRPKYHEDFTRVLPRVLSIYIFSFLDPRSLCRSAQVCWTWKNISELDQLWMRKCLRLGWVLSFSPSPYEMGVWKRLYIENIVALKCLTPKISGDLPLQSLDLMTARTTTTEGLRTSRWGTPRDKDGKRPPWKGSDPTPKDTWMNNYLENDCEIDKVAKLRSKSAYGQEMKAILNAAKNKVNTGNAARRPPSSSMPKSKSVDFRAFVGTRPDWAQPNESQGEAFVNKLNMGDSDPRSAVRESDKPKKVSSVEKMKTIKVMTARSTRDPPTARLFPAQPWKVPDDEDYDSDV